MAIGPRRGELGGGPIAGNSYNQRHGEERANRHADLSVNVAERSSSFDSFARTIRLIIARSFSCVCARVRECVRACV
jgi:hypothetical protein